VVEEWRRFSPSIDAGLAALVAVVARHDGDPDETLGSVEDEICRVRESTTPMPRYLAALLVLRDLMTAGWDVRVADNSVEVRPAAESTAGSTKDAVRRQLLAARTDQFRVETVRRFVEDLEAPPGNARDSIVNLVARGSALARRLRTLVTMPVVERRAALREVCMPYLCVAERGVADPHTGIDLFDVWRYFRYTWTSRYRRSPGRHIPILIRDAAQPQHPVMAIAALSNAVVQLAARDAWVGWTIEGLQAAIARGDVTSREAVSAARGQVLTDLQALYTEDLGFDPSTPPPLDPDLDARLCVIETRAVDLRKQALAGGGATQKVDDVDNVDLVAATRTPLFVSKRAAAARRLLRAIAELDEARDVSALVSAPAGRWALEFALRRVKQRFVASSVMEITTCGAIPPFGPLLGGKLACLLMASPDLRAAYATKYSGEASIIASQMAGRPIVRDPDLVLLCTSSLYPERSSQYNRVRLPKGTIDGQSGDVRYVELGRTTGHGATSFSRATEIALAELAQESNKFRNVNYVFGEGQSAKMRETREGLETLGLDAADLIRHGTRRLIYGASLIENTTRYLLGVDPVPRVSCPATPAASEGIVDFWRARWLAPRIENPEVLAMVEAHEPEYALVSRAWRRPPPVQRRLL